LPDSYVHALQAGARRNRDVFGAYASRLLTMARSNKHHLLWVEKELLPWVPAWLELRMLPNAVPMVLDYDDAVFHTYDAHRSRAVRAVLGHKHAALMRSAALVVCGNDYLAEYARGAGARWVETVPTVVDAKRYARAPVTQRGYRTVVGWIGQRSTAAFLRPFVPLFNRLNADHGLDFHAVGINAEDFGLPMKSSPWTEATEASAIQQFDIGIMPLPDEPFERGKCGYKLIQYMACGLPVVASPVGVNRSIVEHGVTGFLAESSLEWEHALTRLADDSALRARMGAAGREKAERQYSLCSQAPRLAELLSRSARPVGRR
jgi:hypothetical protein